MAGAVGSLQIFVIDQQNTISNNEGGLSSPAFVMGQSFIPTLSGIKAIEINARTLFGSSPMRIDLLNGVVGMDGLRGPILASTPTIEINETVRRAFRFEFADTVPLVPGNTYVMRFVPVGDGSNPQLEVWSGNASVYAGGQLFQLGLPPDFTQDRDFVFAEGIYVAEPGTAAIAVICCVPIIRRRR
jgi:hypothetical protein